MLMYGSLEGYTAATGNTVTNYPKEERKAIRTFSTVCPGFPNEDDFLLLDPAIQEKVLNIIYDTIDYRIENSTDSVGMQSERIGNYSYTRASISEIRALPTDLASELLNLGICGIGFYADCECGCNDK